MKILFLLILCPILSFAQLTDSKYILELNSSISLNTIKQNDLKKDLLSNGISIGILEKYTNSCEIGWEAGINRINNQYYWALLNNIKIIPELSNSNINISIKHGLIINSLYQSYMILPQLGYSNNLYYINLGLKFHPIVLENQFHKKQEMRWLQMFQSSIGYQF